VGYGVSHGFTNTEDHTWRWSGLSSTGAFAVPNSLEPWKKSWAKGCRFLSVWMIGAGGGGGGGHTKAVGAAGGGGGGGGSGGIVRAIFPLDALPETVYFYLPQGGRGGGAGVAGEVGGRGMMTMRPSSASTLSEIFLLTGDADAGGGGNGTGAARGGGGTNSTVAVLTSATLSSLALAWSPIVGIAGAVGGNQGGGAGANNSAATLLSGGAGGGGSQAADFAGGTVTGAAHMTSITGGLAGPNEGASGLWTRESPFYPWYATGGAGGGSTNTAGTTGGRGGNAAPGCGGGGGGAGVVAGGAGGNGGDAYALIIAY
jgi:hypothetical protein